MWFRERREARPTTHGPVRCDATLVVHADGELECQELALCGADPAVHEWEIPCTELHPACGCTGDERPLPHLLGRAA